MTVWGVIMKFTKMHGIGNDYIYVNCFIEKLENPCKYAKLWSDRHFGIGSDGLVLILPSLIADFKMEMYNSDGSCAEMCGNATICIGKYVYDNHMISKKEITLETLAGIKKIVLNVENDIVTTVKVDMGVPKFDLISDDIKDNNINVDGLDFNIVCVSMGNPHVVVFIEEDIDNFYINKIGSDIENYHLFPKRTNVEFVNVIDENNIKIRVWERGAGETLSCGTGACAASTASISNGYCNNKITVHLKGGNLFIQWNKLTNHIYMTGTATKVFEGEI